VLRAGNVPQGLRRTVVDTYVSATRESAGLIGDAQRSEL